ncbi:MAG: stage II sporulation protein M [Synergistaceae bacterium]|jgi:uncharacterized membrane protein SpoIIM required for sporulation|nr:stage II sporulation protein M [Synergistaceae bacterium]
MVPHDSRGEQRRPITLRSTAFRSAREQGWKRLDELADKAEKNGITSLSASESSELPSLYRAVVSSLSVARSIALDRSLLIYLENLTLRSYLIVYGPRAGMLQKFTEFFRRDFPRTVRELRRNLALAFTVMLAGTIAGYFLVMSDISYYDILIPPSLAGGRGPESTAEELIKDELFAPWSGFAESFMLFSSYLFQHNTRVGIFSFGLGFLFGVPTLLLMAYNGAVLGAFVALHARVGLTVDSIAWLSIHGVTEILAILLCAAAGLKIAETILFPGAKTRLESLASDGRRAAGAAAGTVALFLTAGILEGGFRQLISSTPGRFAFASVTAVIWTLYFTYAGRSADDA